MIPTLLIDMDGVLSDLLQQVCIFTGRDYKAVCDNWVLGNYEIPEALNMPEGEFFGQTLCGNEDFWSTMPEMPHSDELLNWLSDKKWYICTSPTLNPECFSGKYKWLQKKFGAGFRKLVITPHKHVLATPNSILIDDSGFKCNLFEEKEGKTILYPTIFNKNFTMRENPVAYVKQEYDRICTSLL